MVDKIKRDIEKKKARRIEEAKQLRQLEKKLSNPVMPKKPMEFSFDKGKTSSFEYPVSIGNTLLEKKSDGNCVHIIVDKKPEFSVRIYSSDLNAWNPDCFPDVLPSLQKLPAGYYHGELLGLNPGREGFASLDEFNAIKSRPKQSIKRITRELLEQYPLKLDIFDVLRLEKKVMLAKPFTERRSELERVVEQSKNLNLIEQWNVSNAKETQERFLWAINQGYEGLIAKDPESLYVPDSRDTDWIKLKEFTTFDLAVLGFYETPASKNAGKLFSAALVGTYNPKSAKFETMTKVKIGARKEQENIWARAKHKVRTAADYNKTIAANNKIIFNPEMQKIKRKIPDYIVRYEPSDAIVILELQVQDVTYSENWHSCGLKNGRAHSFRISSYKQLRQDKNRIQDITTTQQIKDYYTGV